MLISERREPERCGHVARGDGPHALQPAAHEIGDGLLALPDLLGLLGRRLDVRIAPAVRIHRLDQRQTFGAHPEDV